MTTVTPVWRLLETPPDRIDSLRASGLTDVPDAVLAMAAQRGLDTFGAVRDVCNPSMNQLHDPFRMRDMDTAVERLGEALRGRQRILVYGDYDVDGTTAVTLVHHLLKPLFDHIDLYIPDRATEGYGLSDAGIDHAIATGTDVLITLDCGIKATDRIERARDAGIDVIVCDHHLPPADLPPAHAILDPKRTGCPYPFKELSGCGIGFKLMQALYHRQGLKMDPVLAALDLVAVSTASDLVPMRGENRVLTHFGLMRLNTAPRPGLRRLMEVCDIAPGSVTVQDIVFRIGPRINAAGRLRHARFAVEVLSGETADAVDLHDLNRKRQDTDRSITAEAVDLLSASDQERRTIVVFQPHWHKGVVGIVASRLVERYHKPTIVLCEHDGEVTGSARSVPGFDVHAALADCDDLLTRWGGHMYAAGMSLRPESVPAFRDRFEQAVASRIRPEHLRPVVDITATLSPADVTLSFLNTVQRFAPFGPENMEPVFQMLGVEDTGRSRRVGTEGDHLKIEVRGPDGSTADGIAFGLGDRIDLLRNGPVDLCFTLARNEWNGRVSAQMMVRDVRRVQDRVTANA